MVKMLLLFTKIIFCLPPMHSSILQILFDPQLSQKSTRSLMKLPVNPYCPLMPLSPPNLLKTSMVLVWHELWPDRYRLTICFHPMCPYSSKNLHRFICALFSPLPFRWKRIPATDLSGRILLHGAVTYLF